MDCSPEGNPLLWWESLRERTHASGATWFLSELKDV